MLIIKFYTDYYFQQFLIEISGFYRFSYFMSSPLSYYNSSKINLIFYRSCFRKAINKSDDMRSLWAISLFIASQEHFRVLNSRMRLMSLLRALVVLQNTDRLEAENSTLYWLHESKFCVLLKICSTRDI